MRNLLLLVLISLCVPFSQSLYAQEKDPRYWDGVVYFQLKPELNLRLQSYNRENNNGRALGRAYEEFPEVLSVLENHQVKSLDVAFKSLSTPSVRNIYRLEFDDHAQVSGILQTLKKSTRIAFAERAPKNYRAALPNDPELGKLWFLETIEAEGGWDLAVPKKEVVVAVVDDAVSIEHEDLEGNLWRNTAELNGTQGIDDDGNGYVDDFFGWDGAETDNNPNPPSNANDQYFMHGTHVAGTVGAVTNNGRGIAALSYNTAKIMSCKGGRDSDGALTGIWEAFAYAVANNPDIINNSWGRSVSQDGTPPAPLAQFERALLDEAFQKGIIVLFAAMNENVNISWPAAYERVIGVAATGNLNTGIRDEKASYSNFGSWVDISAPGSQVFSLSPGPSRYVNLNGTSMATPNTASLVALMMSHAPDLNANQIVNCLLSSSDNIDAQNSNFIGLLGRGRINVRKAIECVSNTDNTSCGVPANLLVSNITNTEARLNWNAVNGATGYNVEIRAVGNPNWFSFQENPFPNNLVNAFGLVEGTEYEFRVQTVCNQSVSTFSNPFTFRTTGGDNPVGNACVSYNDLYTNFSDGGNCNNNPIVGDFQVWTNEAYRINNCVPGQTYTFSICNGYDPNTWKARLTAALLDENDAPTDVLATIEGCELSFTIPASFQNPVNAVVVVADAEDCGGATRQLNNGVPALSCQASLSPCLSFNAFYDTFLDGGNCNNNPIVANFQVWTNEAYRIDACVPGQTYTFSFCDGYNSNTWRAQISAALIESNNTLSDILATAEGCELSFTVPTDFQSPVSVMVVVSDATDCGGQTQEINNGTPSLSCQGGGGLCSIPAELGAEDIANNQAFIVWDSVPGSDSYTIQARPTGTQEWTEAIGFTGTRTRYSNLLPCTEYEFRVRAQCGSDFSEFSDPFRFLTTGCEATCPSPTNVSAIPNGPTATIAWTGSDSLTEYIVNYRHKAAVTWLSRSTSNTSLLLDSLTNCLTYEYQVIGLCPSGQEAFSSIDTFNVECLDCSPPDSIVFVATTPFNTNIIWNAKPIDLRYIVGAKSANSPTWQEAEILNNEAFYSGLDPCSMYDIRVKAVCTSGESDFSSVRQFTTVGCTGPVYCNSQGENSRFEWIERIEIGPLTNQSGDNFGYQLFEEIAIPSFELGEEFNLSLTPGFLDEIYDEYWRVWIDLNQDGDFNDENEDIFQSQNPTSDPIVGSFTLPADGPTGQTTMRVAMKYFDPATDADPPQSCTTFEFGEVEDYRINLLPAIATNTQEIEEEGERIKVFPNPFRNQLRIEGLLPDHQLRVLDVTGKIVFQLSEANGGKDTFLNLENLESGMYFLEVISNEFQITRKKVIKY